MQTMNRDRWSTGSENPWVEQTDHSLKLYMVELEQHPPLSSEKEQEVLKHAKQGDRDAQDRLITSNLRFVVKVAGEFKNKGLPLSDLIAEGNVGLLRALERFDGDRGVRFISYSVWWIRQAMQNAIKRNTSVAIPMNRFNDLAEMTQRFEQMAQVEGRFPTVDEVSADLGIGRKKAERALKCTCSEVSFDDTSGFLNGDDVQIRGSDDAGPEEQLIEQERMAFVAESMATLSDREQEVIQAFFGLSGVERRTLRAIGVRQGVSRERVRQIKDRALGKMRRHTASRSRCTLQDVL